MGDVAFVLHTHLPYVAHQGVWPVGEEWLFQAWAESWLPVTDVLLRLAEAGHRELLTLGVSPPVAHQLGDDRLRAELGAWIASQMWQSEEQRLEYRGPDRDAIRGLGPFHWRRYAALLELQERVESSGGLLAVWADLQRTGVIELLAGPATHPYLPLMDDGALIDAQLATGLADHERWSGTSPRGLWAPECGYRPRGTVADATSEPVDVDGYGTPTLPRYDDEMPGLEEHYRRHGITHVVVDAATVVRGAGGPDRDWTQRPPVPDHTADSPEEVVYDGVLVGDSDVVAFARDLAVAYHVWSPHSGYPGDPHYREFHAQGYFGVHPSWRVTDKSLPMDHKAPYEPAAAEGRVASHADHLVGVLREVLEPRPEGIVVAAYDTELFGHWWLEGPAWLEATLRRVAEHPGLRTTTLRSRLERRPPRRRLHLPESSWGYAKGHASWSTPATRPMWERLRAAERRLTETVSAHGAEATGDGAVAIALRQAARELACAQASDWPFMVTVGDCAGYAHGRLDAHVQRCVELCDAIGSGETAARLRDLAQQMGRTVEFPSDPSPFLRAGQPAETRP